MARSEKAKAEREHGQSYKFFCRTGGKRHPENCLLQNYKKKEACLA